MNRSVVPLRHAHYLMRREFSTNTPQRFLSRIQWPFVRRPDPTRYRMRVVPPPLQKTKSFARRSIKFVAIFALVYYFLPISIEFGTDDEKGALTEDGFEIEDDDEEESGFFIPLTWPVELERMYYRGSDPEWKEYMKFARDAEHRKRASRAVVMRVRQAFIDIPELAGPIGQVDLNKGRFWLDVFYPPGPPPEYEQLGIEFSRSFIAIAAQTLTQHEYNQLCRWFSVQAAYNSVYSFVSTLAHSVQRIMTPTVRQDSDQQGLSGRAARPGLPIGPVGPMGPIGPARQGHNPLNTPPGMAERSGPHPQNGTDNSSSDADDDEDASKKALQMLADTQQHMRKHFGAPFQETMGMQPPRGCVIWTGLVECLGERFVATVDVVVAWNLAEERIALENISIRNVQPRRLSPRGGIRGERMPPVGSGRVPPR